MKNFSLKTLCCSAFCCVALSFPVYAEEAALGFDDIYVGVDLQNTKINYDGVGADALLEGRLNGVNIHVGNRFNKHFGVELGYSQTEAGKRHTPLGTKVGSGQTTADGNTNIKIRGLVLDVLGYLPLGEDGRFALIGTAGLGYYKAKASGTVPTTDGSVRFVDTNSVGWRVGGGAQVALGENVNLRGLVRYERFNNFNAVNNSWTYSLGLNYHF